MFLSLFKPMTSISSGLSVKYTPETKNPVITSEFQKGWQGPGPPCRPVTPGDPEEMQENCKFQACLGYMGNSKPA